MEATVMRGRLAMRRRVAWDVDAGSDDRGGNGIGVVSTAPWVCGLAFLGEKSKRMRCLDGVDGTEGRDDGGWGRELSSPVEDSNFTLFRARDLSPPSITAFIRFPDMAELARAARTGCRRGSEVI